MFVRAAVMLNGRQCSLRARPLADAVRRAQARGARVDTEFLARTKELAVDIGIGGNPNVVGRAAVSHQVRPDVVRDVDAGVGVASNRAAFRGPLLRSMSDVPTLHKSAAGWAYRND